MRPRKGKSRTPPSSARLWRRLAMLGAGLAVAMAWFDYSHLRRTKPPFVAIVRAEYGSSSRVSIDLPDGGVAILGGFVARKYVKGDRVLVDEFTTPILGLHRYVLAPANKDP